MFYRPEGQLEFTKVPMKRSGKCAYTGSIPGRDVHGDFVHYYVAALDKRGKEIERRGSSGSPNIIEVAAASGGSVSAGDENPLGKSLRVGSDQVYEVTGVMADLPSNTHVQFDFLGSFASLGRIEGDWIYRYWNWPPMYTYALLREGADAGALAARLPAFERENLGEDVAAL